MAEWLGHFLGQFPTWISLPIAFILVVVGLLVTMLFIEPDSSDLFERWYKRRKREKELQHGKK